MPVKRQLYGVSIALISDLNEKSKEQTGITQHSRTHLQPNRQMSVYPIQNDGIASADNLVNLDLW